MTINHVVLVDILQNFTMKKPFVDAVIKNMRYANSLRSVQNIGIKKFHIKNQNYVL